MTSLIPLVFQVSKKHPGRAKKYVAGRDIDDKECGDPAAVTSRKNRVKKSADIGDRRNTESSKRYHEYEKALRRRDFCQVLWMITSGDVPANYETKNGETALLAAVSAKNLSALAVLMKSGVSIDTSNRKGYTPLMKAIAVAVSPHKVPLKRAQAQDLPTLPNNNTENLERVEEDAGSTNAGNFDNHIIESVLAYEPNLLQSDQSGKTAFDWAKLTGNTQALKWLEKRQHEKSIRHQSLANRQERVAQCVKLLKRHEEYVEEIEALIASQFFDEGELAKFLELTTISSAEFAVAIQDLQAMDDTPRPLPFKSQYFVNIENREGWTPLSKCAAFGYVNVVEKLLAMGADLHHETRLRHTAMTWACYCGHEAVCLYLLRFGVDVHQKTRDGRTALLHAITNSQVKIVHHLLVATRDQCFPENAIDTFSNEVDHHEQVQPKRKHTHGKKLKESNPIQIEWHRAFLKIMRWQDQDGQDALKLAQRAVDEAKLTCYELQDTFNADSDGEITPAIQVFRQVERAVKEAEEHKLYVEKHAERTKLTECHYDGCNFTAPRDVLPTHEDHHCLKRTISCEHCGASVIFEDQARHDAKLCPSRKVRCTNFQFGCQERILFQNRDNHLMHHCRKRAVQCRLMCGATLRFDELDAHEGAQCPLRLVICTQGCQATLTANFAKNHLLHDCPKRVVTCTGGNTTKGGCGALVKVEEMAFHLSTLCELRELPCKWFVHGCEEKIGGVASARYHHETNECPFRTVSCRNGCELSGQFLACFAEEHYRWQCMLEKRPCPRACDDMSVLSVPPKVVELSEHLLMVHGLPDAGDCSFRKTYCSLDLCGKHIRLFDTGQENPNTLMSGDFNIAELESRTISLKAMCEHISRYDIFLERLKLPHERGIFNEDKTRQVKSFAEVSQNSLAIEIIVNWLQDFREKLKHKFDELVSQKSAAACVCHILTFERSNGQHLIEFPDGQSIWLALNLREYDVILPTEKDVTSSHLDYFSCGLLESNTLAAHIDNECCHRLVSCPLGCGQRLPARIIETHLTMRCNIRNGTCRLGCGEIMTSSLLAEHEERLCEFRSVFCEFCYLSLHAQTLPLHLDKECQQRPRNCKLGCSSEVAWTDNDEHESNECPKRLTPCRICNESIWFCEREVHENEECPLRVHGDCSAGCGQKLKYNEVAHHLLYSCTKRLINCRQCKQQLKFSDLPEHHALLCPQRVVSCRKGCGMMLKEADAEVHESEECLKRLLFCTNQCGLHVPCCDMEEHLRSQCSMRVMECPTGCREWIFAYLHEDHWKRCRQRIVPCGVGGKLCARPIRVWHQGKKLVRCAVHGESALLWAVRCQDLDLVTYLLQNVDAVNAVNEEFANGFSPLVLASSLGNLDLVQLLLRFGADVNLETSRGRTPMAEACMAQDPAIVKLLIDNRANVSHTNRQGRNLLEMVHTFEATTRTPAANAISQSDKQLESQAKGKEIIRLLDDQAALERDLRELFIAIACSNYDYVIQCLKSSAKPSSHTPSNANVVEELEECVALKKKQAEATHLELEDAIHVFNESIAETEAKRVQTLHLSSQVEDSCRRMQDAEKAEEASETDSNALEADMLAMIREITAQDIAQLLNSHVPDDTTLVVVKALSMLCGVLPRGRRNATEYTDVEWWKTSQALLMDRSLLRRLRGYRQQTVSPDVMSKVRRECLKTPAFAAWSSTFKNKMLASRSSSNSREAGEHNFSSQIPSTNTLRGDIVGILATWVQGVELEYKARSERQVLEERKRQLEVSFNQAREKQQEANFEAQVAARSLPARQEEVEAVRLESDTAEKELVVAKKRLHNYKLLNYAALSGHTPLTFACAVGNEAMVHLLLSHGANSGHHFEEQTLCASFIQVLVRDYQYRKRFEQERLLQEKSAGGIKPRSDGAIEALVRNVAHAFIVGHCKRKLVHFRQTHRVALHEAVFNGHPEIAAALLSRDARVWQKTYVLPERVYPGAPFETIAKLSEVGKEIIKRRGGWKLYPLGEIHEKNDNADATETSELREPMVLAKTLNCAMKHYDSQLFKVLSGWEPPDVTFYTSTAQFVNNILEKIQAARHQWQKEFIMRRNILRKAADLKDKHAVLEAAILSRDFPSISRILDDGAFADYETTGGALSALTVACIEEVYVQNDDGKDVLAVEYLLDRNENRPLVNFESSRGFTALGTSAFYGTLKCAQILIERGASVNMPTRLDSRTVLMVAAGNGKEDFVRFLLAHPEVDVFQVDSKGKSALEYARAAGFVKIMGMLGAAMGGKRGRVVSTISGIYGVCKWGCGFMTPMQGHVVEQAKVIKDTNPLEEHEQYQCPKRHVVCPNKCGARDMWAEGLSDHLRHACARRLVKCTNLKCSVEFSFQHRERHLREECEFREVVCTCGERMTYQRQVGHAKTQCPMRLVPCPLQCKAPQVTGALSERVFELPWQDVKMHVTGDCPHRNVRCRNGCFINDLILKNREHHETRTCFLRRITCKWDCSETVLASTQVIHEQAECELRQLNCPNRCGGMNIPLLELEEHVSTTCPRRLTLCALGCGRRVPLHTMEGHLALECRKRAVLCDLCQLPLLEEERATHQSTQCPQRLAVCGLCGQTNVTHAKMTHHRSEECRMRQVTCKYQCFVKMLLAHEKERHELWECSFRPIWCPLGCGEVFVCNTLKRHQRVCCMRFVTCGNGCGEELREKYRADHELHYCSMKKARGTGSN